MRASAWVIPTFSVFWLICSCCNCLVISARSSRSVFLRSRLSRMIFCIFCSSSFSAATFPSSSSISRRRPRRLLLFRNAPPVMEPPGLKDSPSNVTIRKVWRYFLAMTMAWSMVSTTSVLPRSCDSRVRYVLSAVTSVSASPITPSSFSAAGFWKLLLRILVRGRNVARPYRFFFRYSIMTLAVCSLSVTIFWILPPRAVSTAVSYAFSTLIRSATTPWIPGWRSFCSITRRILLPYPS